MVRLQGYGYSLFYCHSSLCLEALLWQYFEESCCAPKVRLKWYGFKGFPPHSSRCSGGLFPQYFGGNPNFKGSQRARNPEKFKVANNLESKGTPIEFFKLHALLNYFQLFIGGKKPYTKGVFSFENSSASTGPKRGLVYTKKLFFKAKRRTINIHQSAFKVFVGKPFAQHWCIDFCLLIYK